MVNYDYHMGESDLAELESKVTSWLEENLPSGWMQAIDKGDKAKLYELRLSQNYEEWCEKLGKAGWATPTWPVEYSGAGLDQIQAKRVGEVLSRYKVPRSFNIIGIGMAGPTILQWGSHELKARYLPPLAQHKEIWCQLFSEPGSGSDVASLSTSAVRDGDEWVVNGQKVWTTLAHISAFGLLLARTDPNLPKHAGLSYFIVDMNASGVLVRPLKQMTSDSEFNEVFFSDARIADSHRLGDVGQGWQVATTTLMNERSALSGAGSESGANVGGGPYEAIIASARQNGAWDNSALRDRLMQALIDGRVIKMTNLRAAQNRKSGKPPGPEGSITKLFQAEYNQRLQSLAVDVMGMNASAWSEEDEPASATARGFLRSRANTIEGGTSEIMRNILGERVLGLPREPQVDKDLAWNQIRRSS